ncbi:MAG: 4-(cytidine 5'-diphospho)-2-C-methyl-D-erythritol kinase [Syntrophales bacterium]
MIVRKSPAKVNLLLHVLGKRQDGYHDLATLMQKISLYDEILFIPTGTGIKVTCPDSSLPEDERNIVYRAARALFSRVSESPGIEIVIKKRIPVAAGLGGGSSNAATTLVSLNELFRFNLSPHDLIEIGATIGADVPFFIFGNAAWAFGIGDRLEPAGKIPPMWFVLVNPGFEISTKMVYENLNLGLTKEMIQFNIPKFFSLEDIAGRLWNDLERVTLSLHPALKELKGLLIENGALGSLMSGSGPTVFGVFAGRQDAEKAHRALSRREDLSVFTAHSLE